MNVAFIPVRGGSKSIPMKNIKEINGKPLVYWTVKAASQSKSIDKIYVSTDCELIKDTVNSFDFEKVIVIDRSQETSSDTASTESAMLEFAEKYDFDNIILIQATSPLLMPNDIDGGFELFGLSDCDSVISAVKQYRFIWKNDENGMSFPLNYDVYKRPRRQDFEGYIMENGAFYITSRERLTKSLNRVSGRIKAYIMPDYTAYEIDELDDWIIVEQIMKNHQKMFHQKNKIRMFLTDCDGCLTDGGMYYSENGDELKKFNTRDGVAFSILHNKGIITGVITGENLKLNQRRAEKLHIDELHMGVNDKLSIINQLSEKYNISLEEVAYVGDEINDVSVLEAVGFPCCPHDASKEVLAVSKYISDFGGGYGVIRDLTRKLNLI